ncbi:MAG: hypothetical protein ACXACU_12485 [Candidatus Hodarchaeales archaeon]
MDKKESKLIILNFFPLLLIFMMISPLTPFQAQVMPIECIIVETTGCPTCHNTYLTLIKPFYDAYRDDPSISFKLIDVVTPIGTEWFVNETTRLNINQTEHGLLPWVIFSWNDSQNVIVLDLEELESVEETFLAIIESLDETTIPNTKTTHSSTITENTFSLLPNVAIITILGVIVGGFSFLLYKYIWKAVKLFKFLNSRSLLRLTTFHPSKIIYL